MRGQFFHALRARQNLRAVRKARVLQVRVFSSFYGGVIVAAEQNSFAAHPRALSTKFTLAHKFV